jgi:hypothetical protein
VTAQSPQNAVWLGGLLSSTDALFEQFTVPADATSMHIDFYKWFVSEETTANHDHLIVTIRNTANTVLETVVSYGNPLASTSDSTWVPIGPLNPTGNYAGQTIRLYIQSTTDAANNTNFFLDTTSLTVVACP